MDQHELAALLGDTIDRLARGLVRDEDPEGGLAPLRAIAADLRRARDRPPTTRRGSSRPG